ncbi:MAG: hypothetical protein NZ553_18945 [Caldilinea sp.]|nr:hypothetical protein [Caldilinea sp.]MDW8442558.1 hypothetical protein [Caldilineaceae bacterium]
MTTKNLTQLTHSEPGLPSISAPFFPALQRLIAQAKRRRLSLPLLLFLDAHRPLRFLVEQTLVAAAPMASLLGWDELDAWATVLEDDEALLHLRQTLEAAIRQDEELV